jgi:hypothetical protein
LHQTVNRCGNARCHITHSHTGLPSTLTCWAY